LTFRLMCSDLPSPSASFSPLTAGFWSSSDIAICDRVLLCTPGKRFRTGRFTAGPHNQRLAGPAENDFVTFLTFLYSIFSCDTPDLT
jgi:hypothetical protein